MVRYQKLFRTRILDWRIAIIAWIATFLATGFTFLALDAVWLTWAADKLYRPQIGALMLPTFSLPPAVLFYVLYISGILFFAVGPAVEATAAGGRWTGALLHGAALGLLAYGTYDLTNQATLKNWSSTVTIADLCWGTFVTGAAATVGFMVLSRMVKG